MISVFIPIHHLKNGVTGLRGHVCAFPQKVSDVCYVLPRLPTDVNLIKVIKKYNDSTGQVDTKTFTIRKDKVLAALRWYKQYREVEICEANLTWMSTNEDELPAVKQDESKIDDVDLGPASKQTMDTRKMQLNDQFVGAVNANYDITPNKKHDEVID